MLWYVPCTTSTPAKLPAEPIRYAESKNNNTACKDHSGGTCTSCPEHYYVMKLIVQADTWSDCRQAVMNAYPDAFVMNGMQVGSDFQVPMGPSLWPEFYS